MRDPLTKKVVDIAPSGIRKFFDIVSEMDNVISLGVGEPDFDTPWHIRDEGIYSLEKGRTFYTSNAGLKELREEICKYLKRRFALDYDPITETLITVGGSEAIDLAMRVMLDPGDEVLIPEPCYVSYVPCCILAGGKPQVIELEEKDLFVLSDEIYAELTYGGNHVSFASLPGMKERTITINGFSKSHAMTGWRLGYACGPAPIIKQMTKVHQFAIMCAPTNSQYAAVEALRNGDADVEEMRQAYNGRRRYLLHAFEEMGLPCFEPKGAFYVFPSIQKFGLSSDEFAERLLREERLAVVPGTAFGECGEGFLRISYAYSLEDLKKALERLKHFIRKLEAEK